MRPQVHDAAGVALAVDIAQHEFQVGHLDDPMGPHLEVDQEEIAFPFKKGIPPFGQVHDRQQVFIIQIVGIVGEDVAGTVEGSDAQVEGIAFPRRFDERRRCRHKSVIQINPVHIGQDLQEDDILFFTVVAPLVVRPHDGRIAAALGRGAALQDG